MDKLQIHIQSPIRFREAIRISGDAYDTLKKLSQESGISMAQIASEMILFSSERIEFIKE